MGSIRSFLCITAYISISTCSGWDYTNTDSWKHKYPKCAGSKQSPVALVEKDMSENSQLTPLQFIGGTPTFTGTMRHFGLSATLLFPYGLMVRGGNLGEDFLLHGLTFHWAENSATGSEHTLNGKTYPMEMQIYGFRKSLGRFDTAMFRPDGLAALAFFIEEGDTDNTNFDPTTNILAKGDDVLVPGVSLTGITGGKISTYFRYKGSFTSPPCMETVIWTTFKEPLSMSAAQINKFRNLTLNSPSVPLVKNYRPVQPLNSRKVFTQPLQTTKSPQTTENPETTNSEGPQQTTNSPQTTQPMKPKKTTLTTELPHTTEPMKSPLTSQPMKPEQTTLTTELPQTTEPMKSLLTSQPMKPEQTTLTTELPQTTEPIKSPQTTQLMEHQQTTQPAEPPQTTQHTELPQTTHNQTTQTSPFPQLNRSERVISSFSVFFSFGVVLMSCLLF